MAKRRNGLLAAQVAAQKNKVVRLSVGSLALGAAVASQAALLAAIVDRSFARGEPIASLAGWVGLLLVVMAARALLV